MYSTPQDALSIMPNPYRERLESDLASVLASDDAEHQLHEAISELRLYREGRLNVDRLNTLHGQCEGAPGGAARHHAITELLVRAVLDAHQAWSERAV